MAWDREFFYDTYPRVEEAFGARLDESLAPRDPSILLQVVRELDLRPDSRVVDVGCGEGAYAFRLATHFGFRVLGIDPVQRHLDLAREARREGVPDIASRVSFERGTATRIPVPDRSLDLVWCRDVMVHVEDPRAAFAEFARALRPGGYVVSYQTVATDLLARRGGGLALRRDGRRARLRRPGRHRPAIAGSGLEVVDTIDLAGEWGERRRRRTATPAGRCCTWRGCCGTPSATAASSAARRTT